MKKVYRANLYFLIIILLEIFLPFILLPIYKVIGITDVRLVLLINHITIFLVPAAIYIKITKSSIKDTLKLNKLHLKDLFLIILLAIVVQPIMAFFSVISAFFFNNEVGSFISQISSTPYLILLSLVALLPAITEEVTIRGIVLSGYENINKYIAALITGLFFGILHLDPQQFLYAVALGFIFALVVRTTNSILAASIMHFIINGTSVTSVKIISILSSNKNFIVEATDMSFRSLAINEKIAILVLYGGIALVFSTLVFLIIKKLEDLNTKRGILRESNISRGTIKQENIFNLPFIGIIIVYLTFMIIKIL
ncbi:type II CAAX endopeptidase family protein [Clostridium carnis]